MRLRMHYYSPSILSEANEVAIRYLHYIMRAGMEHMIKRKKGFVLRLLPSSQMSH